MKGEYWVALMLGILALAIWIFDAIVFFSSI